MSLMLCQHLNEAIIIMSSVSFDVGYWHNCYDGPAVVHVLSGNIYTICYSKTST